MQIRLLAGAIAALLLANCSGPSVTRGPMGTSARVSAPERTAHYRTHRHHHRRGIAHDSSRGTKGGSEGTQGGSGEAQGGSVGVASYYGAGGLTAAHRSLPFGTRVRVTNTANGQSVVVRIADRGPFIRGRSIDLSRSAAHAVGMTETGVAKVRMEVLQ